MQTSGSGIGRVSVPTQARWGLLTLLAAVSVQADAYNHKLVLVGDKGAAYGGAFAGLADDATATWYNPAGLTQLKQLKLNVSAQIVQYQKQRIGITDEENIPYNSFNFSPSITSMSQKLGRWAYGFSIVTPQNDLYQGSQKLDGSYYSTSPDDLCHSEEEINTCSSRLGLNYYELNKTNWIGASLAYTYSENLSVGISLFGIYANLIEKTSYGSTQSQFVGGDSTDRTKFYDNVVNRDIAQTGYGFSAAFGILMRLAPGLSLGVMATPGSYVYCGRKEAQRIELFFNERSILPTTEDTVVSQAILYSLDESARHVEITAPSVALGGAWTPTGFITLTGQIDYHLGSSYSYTGYSPKDNADARSYFEMRVPEKFRYVVDKNSVVNFSGGVDMRFNDTYSLALGGYTDKSQGPYDTRPASWNRRIDWYGGVISVGMTKQYTESRFGIAAAYGDAGISHFRWDYDEDGGQPFIVSSKGEVVRFRQLFKAYSLAVFLSSTLKV